jgi:hypothetical protein
MQSDFPVILDACVLASGAVMAKLAAMARASQNGSEIEDLLIRLGKTIPRFSSQILSEMGLNSD